MYVLMLPPSGLTGQLLAIEGVVLCFARMASTKRDAFVA
jgi:hypothetical protein